MIKNIGNYIILLTAIYHLFAGIFVIGPKSWAKKFGKKTYNLSSPDLYEPRYEVNLKFMGHLSIALSIILISIYDLGNDKLSSTTLFIIGSMFLIRALFRIILKKEFLDGYNLNFKRSLYNIIVNVLLGLFTLYCAIIIKLEIL